MRDTLDIAVDISNITQDKANMTGRDYKELIEEKKKYLATDQSKQGTNVNETIFNNIIPLQGNLNNT